MASNTEEITKQPDILYHPLQNVPLPQCNFLPHSSKADPLTFNDDNNDSLSSINGAVTDTNNIDISSEYSRKNHLFHSEESNNENFTDYVSPSCSSDTSESISERYLQNIKFTTADECVSDISTCSGSEFLPSFISSDTSNNTSKTDESNTSLQNSNKGTFSECNITRALSPRIHKDNKKIGK